MKKFFEFLFRAVYIILIADLALTVLWGWRVLKYFDEQPKKQAPVAVVLMADFDEKSGELGAETRRRLDHARVLYNKEKIEYILCVGGARPKLNMYGSEYMREFLVEKGVPEGRVFLEKRSYDSRTNWRETKTLLKNYGWHNVTMISSPFHLFRFREIIREAPSIYLKVYLSPYSLREARPKTSLMDIWVEIHYQWAAHYSRLLPDSMYDMLLKHIRSL